MTTFLKTKLKKSDDQTIIDKYREAAYITEYYVISNHMLYCYDSKMREMVKNNGDRVRSDSAAVLSNFHNNLHKINYKVQC